MEGGRGTYLPAHSCLLSHICTSRLGHRSPPEAADEARSHTLSMVLQGGLKQCEGPEPRGLGWVGLDWVGWDLGAGLLRLPLEWARWRRSWLQALTQGKLRQPGVSSNEGMVTACAFHLRKSLRSWGKLGPRKSGDAHKVVVVQWWIPEEPRDPREKCHRGWCFCAHRGGS